ncbi:hypothetical protein ACFWII_33845 [Streptomyces sp. NPDC127063]|uniref:hypothetical protein n=1 Tax=Streptomyces sp. NPDC127063 TaxID=3347123 RepID=UPI0036462E5A
MSVTVTKTGDRSVTITWDASDRFISAITDADTLAYALELLAGGREEPTTPGELAFATGHTAQLARMLQQCAAQQVVRLRDEHGMSWRQIAAEVLYDPDRQSSVRRMYDSGRRNPLI